jgi:hypothetical protein
MLLGMPQLLRQVPVNNGVADFFHYPTLRTELFAGRVLNQEI